MVRFLAFSDLAERGIPFSRQHIWRLIKDRRFPSPVKLGGNTNRWVQSEIDDWLRDQIAHRDAIDADEQVA